MRVLQQTRPNSRFLGLAALACLTLPLPGQQPPANPRLDRAKSDVIEPPAAKIVRDSATVPAPAKPPVRAVPDGGKRVIEFPTKNLVASSATESPARNTRAVVAGAGANPTVKPGDVRWHPSFAEARAAAQKSGKPVLLFHMMGELDKQFC